MSKPNKPIRYKQNQTKLPNTTKRSRIEQPKSHPKNKPTSTTNHNCPNNSMQIKTTTTTKIKTTINTKNILPKTS